MNLIINKSTLEILAVADTRMEAEIVMDALRERHEYSVYAPSTDITEHRADINKDSIINSLRRMGQTHKIEAIKVYRSIYSVGLTEAKDVIEGADPSF